MFKEIEGYCGRYQINEDGVVINVQRGRERKQQVARGYKRVTLCLGGKNKNFLVHRLVAKVFLDDYSEDLQVNHKDENKFNNNVSNLEMCTSKYNNNYGTRNERISKKNKGVMNVGKHLSPATEFKKGHRPWCKGIPAYWRFKKVKCVQTGEIFPSVTDAAKKYECAVQNIIRCCKKGGKARGLNWEYAK